MFDNQTCYTHFLIWPMYSGDPTGSGLVHTALHKYDARGLFSVLVGVNLEKNTY